MIKSNDSGLIRKYPLLHTVIKGEGRYSITGIISYTTDGIVVQLCGGEKPHIGTVVLSQPRPSLANDENTSATTSILNLLNHKDDIAAKPVAEMLAKTLNQVVVVTAGIHVDNAAEHDIEILQSNIQQVADELLKWASSVNKA